MEVREFHKVDSCGPVTKFERATKTPMPAEPDGSGYKSEDNKQTLYEVGEYYVEVSKVSNLGWSVKRRDADGLEKMNSGYLDTEEAAHEVAREMVQEVVED
jgi:hypothetical protein